MQIDQMTFNFLGTAISHAKNGVNYNTKNGAECPACGQRLRVTHTMPWLGNSRKRYHKCKNPSCIMFTIDETIYSWQEI